MYDYMSFMLPLMEVYLFENVWVWIIGSLVAWGIIIGIFYEPGYDCFIEVYTLPAVFAVLGAVVTPVVVWLVVMLAPIIAGIVALGAAGAGINIATKHWKEKRNV